MKKLFLSDKDRKRAWYRKHRMKSRPCHISDCNILIHNKHGFCEYHYFASEEGRAYERARKSLVRNTGVGFSEIGKELLSTLVRLELTKEEICKKS